MIKLDTGKKIDVLVEGTFRQKFEMRDGCVVIDGTTAVLAYQDAMVNAEVDGKLLKGLRIVVFFER